MRNFKFNPFFVVLLIMMGFSSLRQYSGVAEWMMHMALILPGVIIGLSFHEFAHAAMANALGDPTAKNMGRMSRYDSSLRCRRALRLLRGRK